MSKTTKNVGVCLCTHTTEVHPTAECIEQAAERFAQADRLSAAVAQGNEDAIGDCFEECQGHKDEDLIVARPRRHTYPCDCGEGYWWHVGRGLDAALDEMEARMKADLDPEADRRRLEEFAARLEAFGRAAAEVSHCAYQPVQIVVPSTDGYDEAVENAPARLVHALPQDDGTGIDQAHTARPTLRPIDGEEARAKVVDAVLEHLAQHFADRAVSDATFVEAVLDYLGEPADAWQWAEYFRDQRDEVESQRVAAEAENRELRAEVKRLGDLLQTVANDATARDACREAAEAERDALRAEVERHALANGGCVPANAYRDLTAETRRRGADLAAARAALADREAVIERVERLVTGESHQALVDQITAVRFTDDDGNDIGPMPSGHAEIAVTLALADLRAALAPSVPTEGGRE